MMIDAVLRAARILQSQPGYTMPLVQLHAQLVREMGSAAGSYSEIYQHLCKQRDSFAISNSPRLLTGADSWPGLVREAYDHALGGTGLGSCIRVTLTETESRDEHADVVAALSTTIGELIANTSCDDVLTAYIEAATQELAEINSALTHAETARPTILLPDLPPTG